MLTTDLQEFRFCFSWLMNRRLALMGPCREHIARASLASPAPSNWAGGMAPQGKVSSELGCVPAVGPCRDPPPPPSVDKSPGTCPKMSPAAGSPVLGGGSPHCHQQTQVVPFPGKELLASAVGSSSRGRFWGLCPWGLSPPSLPPSLSLLPCCCPPQPLSLASPPVCAQPSVEAAPFSHRPSSDRQVPSTPRPPAALGGCSPLSGPFW